MVFTTQEARALFVWPWPHTIICIVPTLSSSQRSKRPPWSTIVTVTFVPELDRSDRSQHRVQNQKHPLFFHFMMEVTQNELFSYTKTNKPRMRRLGGRHISKINMQKAMKIAILILGPIFF